nr:MAG TPA: hypothetical protein [Caudoviricetes sp.]
MVQSSVMPPTSENSCSEIGRIYCLFWVGFTAYFGMSICRGANFFGILHLKKIRKLG